MKATVLFLVNAQEAFAGATIEGVGDHGNYFAATGVDFVEIGGKDYARAVIESTDPLDDFEDWYDPLGIDWTLRAGGRWLLQTSENEVFVTLGTPWRGAPGRHATSFRV